MGLGHQQAGLIVLSRQLSTFLSDQYYPWGKLVSPPFPELKGIYQNQLNDKIDIEQLQSKK